MTIARSVFLCLVAFACDTMVGQEPEPGRATRLRKLIDEAVNWYQLFPRADISDPMKPVVILRWPNNARGTPDGASVVWIANGRPEAIAGIFPYEGDFFHGFDSLSRGLIVAIRDGRLAWYPEKPGLNFQTIPGSPEPAQTRAKRLRQMKALAQQFRSTLLGWEDDDSEREELRLLPSPIYRYEIAKPDRVLDGGLFAFVSGTDPEAALVIEAFDGEDHWEWQYALVRQTSGKLEARFQEKVVWQVDRYPEVDDPRSVHVEFSCRLNEVLPPEEE